MNKPFIRKPKLKELFLCCYYTWKKELVFLSVKSFALLRKEYGLKLVTSNTEAFPGT